jgi:hypothetical protein
MAERWKTTAGIEYQVEPGRGYVELSQEELWLVWMAIDESYSQPWAHQRLTRSQRGRLAAIAQAFKGAEMLAERLEKGEGG